jgi:hypothetical protein
MAEESFGNSDSPANEKAMEYVAELMNVIQGSNIVQRFVLLVETFDGEDRWFSSFTAPKQKAWDTLGLLEYGKSIENNFQSLSTLNGEEDEDDPSK